MIYVKTSGSKQALMSKGGAETSVTGDDVFSTEGETLPELPGRDAEGNRVLDASSWAILITTTIAISSIALVFGIVGGYLEVGVGGGVGCNWVCIKSAVGWSNLGLSRWSLGW